MPSSDNPFLPKSGVPISTWHKPGERHPSMLSDDDVGPDNDAPTTDPPPSTAQSRLAYPDGHFTDR